MAVVLTLIAQGKGTGTGPTEASVPVTSGKAYLVVVGGFSGYTTSSPVTGVTATGFSFGSPVYQRGQDAAGTSIAAFLAECTVSGTPTFTFAVSGGAPSSWLIYECDSNATFVAGSGVFSNSLSRAPNAYASTDNTGISVCMSTAPDTGNSLTVGGSWDEIGIEIDLDIDGWGGSPLALAFLNTTAATATWTETDGAGQALTVCFELAPGAGGGGGDEPLLWLQEAPQEIAAVPDDWSWWAQEDAAPEPELPGAELGPDWMHDAPAVPADYSQWFLEEDDQAIFEGGPDWLQEPVLVPEDHQWTLAEDLQEDAHYSDLGPEWLFEPTQPTEDVQYAALEDLPEDAVYSELGPDWIHEAPPVPEDTQWVLAEDLPEDAVYTEFGPEWLADALPVPQDHQWTLAEDLLEDALYSDLSPEWLMDALPVPQDHQWVMPVDLPEDALYLDVPADWQLEPLPVPQDWFAAVMPEDVISIIAIPELTTVHRYAQVEQTTSFSGVNAEHGFAQHMHIFKRPRKPF